MGSLCDRRSLGVVLWIASWRRSFFQSPQLVLGSITPPPMESTGESFFGSKVVQELIPGIPNEIILGNVCPKLAWGTLDTLSLVSHTWQKAIASREVYNARVRARSTETLLVHYDVHGKLALYSIRNRCFYELPPIPGRREAEYIGLDGKVYALGGDDRCAGVYVLDIAAHRGWKQCASLLEPRYSFGCGSSGGKIYVFEGLDPRGCTYPLGGLRSEVYDLILNEWSSISPKPLNRYDYCVATVGDELFVYGGCSSDAVNWKLRLEVYHSTKNEWRVLGQFRPDDEDAVFTAKGELQTMTEFGVDVYDIKKDSQTRRHTHCFPEDFLDTEGVYVYRALAVEDEILTEVWFPRDYRSLLCLFQSQGFDSGKEEITWLQIQWYDPAGRPEFLCALSV